MAGVRVCLRSAGDEQPLVSSHSPHSPHTPAGMASSHHNEGLQSTVLTTHFPSHLPSSPLRQSHREQLPNHSPTRNVTKRNSSSPSRADSSKRQSSHSAASTPTRHSHTPTVTHISSSSPIRVSTSSRHSHPLTCSSPRSPGRGITLSPASHDTSKIIHEKNKSVTIVLGEQHVTYTSPDHGSAVVRITDDDAATSAPTTPSKLSSVIAINATNAADGDATLKCHARLTQNVDARPARDASNGVGAVNGLGRSAANPILDQHDRKTSYNSTAYTKHGGSTYNSANGVAKSWHEECAGSCLQQDGALGDDWRRSTSTLVPPSVSKGGGVSWRGVGCSLSGAALVVSAAAMLRLPGLLLLYGPGTFVVTLLVCVVCVAAPLALLQAGLAQFSSCSVLAVWRFLPIARGVGWSLVVLCCVWGAVAAGLAAPWLHYFLVTTTPPGAIHGVEVGSCSWDSVTTPDQALHYYRLCVYGTSAEVTGLAFNWPLPAGLLALAFTAFVGAGGGATLRALVSGAAALLVLAGVTAQGCVTAWRLSVLVSGAQPYFHLLAPFLKPNYSVLATPQVWLAGLGQALLMLGPGTALLLNHASHLPFRFHLRRHVILLTLLCLLVTAIVSSVTVLQMGLIKHEQHRLDQPTVTRFVRRSLRDVPVVAAGGGAVEELQGDLNLRIVRIAVPDGKDSNNDNYKKMSLNLKESDNVNGFQKSSLSTGKKPDHFIRRRAVERVASLLPSTGEFPALDTTISPSSDDYISTAAFSQDTHVPPLPSSLLVPPPGRTLLPLLLSDSTIPVLSLMSPDAQTTAAVAHSDDEATASLRHHTPDTLLPLVEGVSSPISTHSAMEASLGTTICTEETEAAASEGTTRVPLLAEEGQERPEDCMLQLITDGPSPTGLCSHQEVSVGAVFLLSSYSLLPQHVPLAWLRHVVGALVMGGLLCSGVTSLCGCLYVVGVAVKESGGGGVLVGAGCALAGTLMAAAPLVAQGGLQLLSLLDVGVLVPSLVWPSIVITTTVAAAYGMDKLSKDFTFMLESKLSRVWALLWAAAIPGLLLGVFVWQCVYWWLDGYVYAVAESSVKLSASNGTFVLGTTDTNSVVLIHWWQMGLLWLLRILLVLPIPVTAVRVVNAQLAYGVKDKLVSSLQSSREWGEWGPQDPIEHHLWRRWREDETLPFTSLRSQFAARPLTYTHSTLSRNSSSGGSSLARLRAKYQKKEPLAPAAATAL